MNLSTLRAALALTIAGAATSFAGDPGPNMSLFPGMNRTSPVIDEHPEVRRATSVLDPRDQTRISAGSLWRDGVTNESGMFADRKARRRGDVLTLVVSETVNITNTINQQTSKNNSISNGILDSYLLNLPKNLRIAKQAPAAAAGSTGTTGTTVSSALGLTTASGGNSQLTNQQSLDARAAMTVTDVLPNGNLVVEGTRIVTFSGETKYAQLSGIVRGDDVAADDTVQSANLADAKVQFFSEGSLTDAQRKGWLSRTIDRFNPL